MKRLSVFTFVFAVLMIATAAPAFADPGFYSGSLTSALPSMTDRPDGCASLSSAGTYYYTTETLQVPTTQGYGYVDFFNTIDTYVILYPEGGFDPSNPLTNCVVTFDETAQGITLNAGPYTMVITSFGSGLTGPYEFVLGFPGVVDGEFADAGVLPNGRPNDDSTNCKQLIDSQGGYYYVTSNYTPPVSGDYTYHDLYADWATTDLWVSFYIGDFDANNPLTNCIANFDDHRTVFLQAGFTYTLMISTYEPGAPSADEGGADYAFLLLGSGAVGSSDCPYPLPASAVVRSIPGSPAALWAPNLQDGTNFNLPGGEHWYVFGTSGDFAHVWISCEGQPVWVLKSAIVGDLSGFGETTVDLTTVGLAKSAGACPYILPSNAVVESLPSDAPTYFAPDWKDGTNFNIPAGHWWVAATHGDFSQLWISCQAQPVWVLTKALTP